ncbi:MAG: uridine kinase [Candidatus Heimdallarchaeota archaeon]|nr:uridine kinase [Candidatus Heimdallarchaeota archaeon]
MSTFILAVSGPTNAGKSYFTDRLKIHALEKGIKVSSISTDEFYRDLSHLSMDERNKVNYDHPDSIDEKEFIVALEDISKGLEVEIPIYDFSIHNRTGNKRKIDNVDLLIVEGIFTCTFNQADALYSLRIYIDMDDDVRVIRRIQRDMEDRGRSLDSVINQYMNTVKPTQFDFVQRDKKKVDIVLKGNRDHSIIIDMIVSFVKNK